MNAVETMLDHIGEDLGREGLKQTPARVLKAWEFMFKGYKENPQEILRSALFSSKNNKMILIKNVEFYSFCEHHLLPIIGKAHVAYIPRKKVCGLSKIPYVIEAFARRLQIQEELTEQIAYTIDKALNPKGVAVVIEARHMCMEMRGVQKSCSTTTTSALRGKFYAVNTRTEFFSLISSEIHH